MEPVVIQGTLLKCSFGNLCTPIMVQADKKVNATFPVAVKSNHIPFLNILPFGMCSNPANPMVAAATAAALGVPTTAPCVPCTGEDWSGGSSKVKIGGKEAIHAGSCLKCLYGGNIRAVVPLKPNIVML